MVCAQLIYYSRSSNRRRIALGDRTVKGIVDFVLKELPVLDIDNADDSFYSLSDMHWPFRIALLVDGS
jgi:hypothetical protein